MNERHQIAKCANGTRSQDRCRSSKSRSDRIAFNKEARLPSGPSGHEPSEPSGYEPSVLSSFEPPEAIAGFPNGSSKLAYAAPGKSIIFPIVP